MPSDQNDSRLMAWYAQAATEPGTAYVEAKRALSVGFSARNRLTAETHQPMELTRNKPGFGVHGMPTLQQVRSSLKLLGSRSLSREFACNGRLIEPSPVANSR